MKLYIDIYGIKVQVSTKNTSLFQMIQKYYEPFLVLKIKKVDIDIDLERFSYFWRKKNFVLSDNFITFWDWVKIDRKNSAYFFTHQEISGRIDFSKWKITVQGKLIPHTLRHLVHIALQWVTRIDKYYNRFIIKSCIHDMIFIFLEKKLQSCLLHATAVTNGKKTFVFTGLGGSGKSTLASAFSHMKGYTILSDNYAIVSGNRIYPFPELPRVTKGTQELLGITLHKKADGIKNYLENNIEGIQKNYQIDGIFICSYWKTSNMERLQDKDYIFELLYSINTYTKEFPEHSNIAIASVINRFNTNKQRIHNLEKIIEINNFYLLQSNKDLWDIINKISHV